MKRSYSLVPARVRAAGRFRYVLREGGASLRQWNVSRDELIVPMYIDLGDGETLPVTHVGQEAFYNTNARCIGLPDTVRTIGVRAFAASDALRVVRVPASVRMIDSSAFAASPDVVLEVEEGSYAWRFAQVKGLRYTTSSADCPQEPDRRHVCGDWVYRLTEEGRAVLREYCGDCEALDVPAQVDGYPVVRLEDWCFDSNPFLREVYIPEGVTSLGVECFGRCVQLQHVSLPDSLQWLGEGAFANCIRLREVVIPDGVRRIPGLCFARCCRLREVMLPAHLRHIGHFAFCSCQELRMIFLPDRVEKLAAGVFFGCESLEYIALNEGLRQIGPNAFQHCEALRMPEAPATLEESAMDALRDLPGWPED